MEQWQPLPHLRQDTYVGRILFRLRLILDLHASTVYCDLKKALSGQKGNVLDVGCGGQPYRKLVPPEASYHSIDWEGTKEFFHYQSPGTVYYNGKDFPLAANTFDLVFHTEVAEHVFDIQTFLGECCRVLRPGAQMFFTVPFNARYHYVPHDYWRFTPSCLQKLLEDAGFTAIRIDPRGNDIVVMALKTNTVFYRIIFMKVGPMVVDLAWKALWGVFFALPIVFFTAVGHAALALSFGSKDDPLGYSVYCRKK